MVAALGDFDIGRSARRGEQARGGFVVEIGGQQVRRALPRVAIEAALALTGSPSAARAIWLCVPACDSLPALGSACAVASEC